MVVMYIQGTRPVLIEPYKSFLLPHLLPMGMPVEGPEVHIVIDLLPFVELWRGAATLVVVPLAKLLV